MRPLVVVLVLLTVASLVPPSAAQDHQHAGASAGLLLIADTPEDGRTWVGDVTHFSYVILTEDGRPEPHHDVHVHVALNGATLYATEWAHDYDGVGGLDIVFPVTGTYNVTVTVPGSPARVAHFEGYVLPLTEPTRAQIDLSASDTAEAGTLVPFTYAITDPTGAILPHTDALVEIRRLADDFPVLNVHTHTHTEAMTFDYAFEKAGTYLVTIVGYTAFPDIDAIPFHPVVTTHLVTVTGDARPAEPPGLPIDVDETVEWAIQDETRRTETAVDPASGTDMKIGPFSQARTSVVTYDETMPMLVQHLNYEAILRGPYGMIFRSTSLHEYDGVLEIMNANQMLGTYTWDVTVKQGDWSTHRHVAYEVVAANLPLQAGPQFIDVDGLDRLTAGAAGDVTFFVHGLGDVPFQHSEVAFRLYDRAGLPLVDHKVHTHATGTFAFRYTPPTPGEYTLRVDPFDVHGSPTPRYYGRTMDAPRALDFTIASGTALVPGDVTLVGEDVQDEVVPTAPIGLLVGLLGLVVVLRRRMTA